MTGLLHLHSFVYIFLRYYVYISIGAFIVYMIFTNPRKNTPLNPQPTEFPRSFASRRPMVSLVQNIPEPPVSGTKAVSTTTEGEPKKKTMKWGEPTWFLFHTLAEKIKPEYFAQYKNELVEIIKTICNSLPCPTCAKHATEYMAKINFATIRTKADLQVLLWSFHNEVNQRKGFPIFPYESVQAKYSKAITRNIIQEFMSHHEDKHASFRMIADDYFRKKVVSNLKTWFLKNIEIFEKD